jgi:hypothetical protein
MNELTIEFNPSPWQLLEITVNMALQNLMQDGLFEFLRRAPLWLQHQWRRNTHKTRNLAGS